MPAVRSASIFAAGFLSCLLLIVAIGFVARLLAQDWLILNGYAQHLGSGSHCNNHLTTGIGIERDHAQLGVYRNSNCRTSLYAAQAWLPLSVGAVKLGLIGGAVTGYASAVTPVAALAATYERKSWGWNLIAIPPTGESSGGVAWLQLKIKLR